MKLYIGKDDKNNFILGINKELVEEKSVEMLTESVITDNDYIKLYATKVYTQDEIKEGIWMDGSVDNDEEETGGNKMKDNIDAKDLNLTFEGTILSDKSRIFELGKLVGKYYKVSVDNDKSRIFELGKLVGKYYKVSVDNDEEETGTVIKRITTEDGKQGLIVVKDNGNVYRTILESLNTRELLRITNYNTNKTVTVDSNSYQLDKDDARRDGYKLLVDVIKDEHDGYLDEDDIVEYLEYHDTAYKQIVCTECDYVLAYVTGSIAIECECCGTINNK